MTTTATTTEKQVDREVPGGGKLQPVHHIVRIVVVRPASDSIAAPESHGPGHSHGLTDGELAASEKILKETPAPPGRELANTMFDALTSTDIVVVGREAASVRTVDNSGKPVSADATRQAGLAASEPKPTRRLFGHDDRHRDTVLRVWTESDTIEYQCDEEFEIVLVERAGWKIYGAPDIPFDNGPLPYRSEQRKRATDGKPIWVWTSSVLPAKANNQQYKMSFRINGELIDPDVACGDPPPTP
jgi:hypothetical protein